MRLVAFWLTKPAEKRKEAEQEWVQAVTKNHPDIATAEALAQAFREMVKNRKAGDLDGWLESAEASGIQELNGFPQASDVITMPSSPGSRNPGVTVRSKTKSTDSNC
jgi:transposase